MSISSPDFYSVVSTDRAVTQVPADTLNSVKLVNQSGGTLYYKSDNTVSSSVNDGSLTAGQSVVLQATTFITTTTTVNVAVIPLTGIQDLGGISAASPV